MKKDAPVLACAFYMSENDTEPVREWLKSLPKVVRHKVGTDVDAVQRRWPVGPPLVDGFGSGLYEVRTKFDGNIYRVMFCIMRSTMVLLHGFQKKTPRTQTQDIDLARKRQAQVKEALS